MKYMLVAASCFLAAPALAQTGFGNVPANQIIGGPTAGAAAPPFPRALVPADISAGMPGINQNVLNQLTANYTLAASDCGKTIQAGTGSTGFFTITVPSTSGLPATCSIVVKNADTARAKGLAGAGLPAGTQTKLYPLQSMTLRIIAGAWYSEGPPRWKLPALTTFYIDNVAGNDANDGLAPGAGNAFASVTPVTAVLNDLIDLNQQFVVVSLQAGQTWSNLEFNLNVVGAGEIILNGNGDTVTGTIANNGAVRVYTSNGNGFPTTGFDYIYIASTFAVQNINFTCSSGSVGLEVLGGYVQISTGNSFGSCPSGVHIKLDANSTRILLRGDYSITGGAAAHLYSIAGGLIDYNSGAFTISLVGTPAFSNCFMKASLNSMVVWVPSISGTATGIKYCVDTNSSINTNLAGAGTIPGNAPGYALQGGVIDAPGVPTTTACGTSPGTPAGADIGGNVVMGSGTVTQCTILFTTNNTPKVCTAALSGGGATGISALNASGVTFIFANAPGQTLYWSCPAT